MRESVPNTAQGEFPLFEGGPFARLQATLRLAGEEQRHVWRRVIFAILATWVSLAMLAAMQGQAIGPTWRESMLLDPAMYARYLVALPFLILATPGCRRRFQMIVPHFLDAGLVKEAERESFFANIAAMIRWRDSVVPAVVLVALAVADAVTFGTVSVTKMPDSWRVVDMAGHRSLSLAGWWLSAVSEPLYKIVMLQLLYRLALWWRFLWKTSRLDLQLNPAHPDGAGGLAFLGIVLPTFCLPVFAVAISAAGALTNLILWMGVSFADFQFAIFAFALAMVALMTGPLLFFSRKLYDEKQRAVLACGALAMRQLRAFDGKWLGASPPAAGEILQAPDFSALADFDATVTSVHEMKTLPFGLKEIVLLAVAALLPFLPVVAIEIPLKEVLLQVLKLIR